MAKVRRKSEATNETKLLQCPRRKPVRFHPHRTPRRHRHHRDLGGDAPARVGQGEAEGPALFDTDNYDNRLYVYERDVWLAYSFPAYSGVGLRNYALVQYKLSQKMDVWFRWSHVRYTDRTEIGSGGEALSGNTGNDVKFQVRMRF